MARVRTQARGRVRRIYGEMPSIVGAFVTFMAVAGLLLLASPWFDVLGGSPGYDRLGTGARLAYGAIFLALVALALWRPARGGGAATAFLAAWAIQQSLAAEPTNVLGAIFWVCVLAWTLVALWRFFVARHRDQGVRR